MIGPCGRRDSDPFAGSTLIRTLKRLAIHCLIAMVATVVCSILGVIFVQVVLTIIGLGGLIRGANLEAWYGPLIWWPGLVLGFFVNRRTLQRAACFVWVPGLLWLAAGILSRATAWRPEGMSWMTQVRIDLFPLKQGECGTTECLYSLFHTWPALNSVAYSIGAALALLTNRDKTKIEEPPTGHTTLGLG